MRLLMILSLEGEKEEGGGGGRIKATISDSNNHRQ